MEGTGGHGIISTTSRTHQHSAASTTDQLPRRVHTPRPTTPCSLADFTYQPHCQPHPEMPRSATPVPSLPSLAINSHFLPHFPSPCFSQRPQVYHGGAPPASAAQQRAGCRPPGAHHAGAGSAAA